MPEKILVAYATGYGATGEVAEVIGQVLREGGALRSDARGFAGFIVRSMLKGMEKPDGADFRNWDVIRAWAASLPAKMNGAA